MKLVNVGFGVATSTSFSATGRQFSVFFGSRVWLSEHGRKSSIGNPTCQVVAVLSSLLPEGNF